MRNGSVHAPRAGGASRDLQGTPELTIGLKHQLDAATVTARENTGGGFYTDISVSTWSEKLETSRVLGHQTYAHVDGLKHGLSFVLFMKDGFLNLLEGYSVGGENTADLTLSSLNFRIDDTPVDA